jgi:hypothetical protein
MKKLANNVKYEILPNNCTAIVLLERMQFPVVTTSMQNNIISNFCEAFANIFLQLQSILHLMKIARDEVQRQMVNCAICIIVMLWAIFLGTLTRIPRRA